MQEFRYGNIIRNIRIKNGLTQEKLAEKVGVNKGTISAYELEKIKPTLTVFYKICVACKTNLIIEIHGQKYTIKQLNRKY